MQTKPCAFCTLPAERVIDSNHYCIVIRDGFPISPGHTLIIPKRHIGSFFELDAEERLDLLNLLEVAKKILDIELNNSLVIDSITDKVSMLNTESKEIIEEIIDSFIKGEEIKITRDDTK